jgi:hypothetical protein
MIIFEVGKPGIQWPVIRSRRQTGMKKAVSIGRTLCKPLQERRYQIWLLLAEQDSNLRRFRRIGLFTISPICPGLRHFLWYLLNKLRERDSNPRRFRRITLLTVKPICPDLRHFLWYLSNKRFVLTKVVVRGFEPLKVSEEPPYLP